MRYSGALRTGTKSVKLDFGLLRCSVDCYAVFKNIESLVLNYPHTPCGLTSSWPCPPSLCVDMAL